MTTPRRIGLVGVSTSGYVLQMAMRYLVRFGGLVSVRQPTRLLTRTTVGALRSGGTQPFRETREKQSIQLALLQGGSPHLESESSMGSIVPACRWNLGEEQASLQQSIFSSLLRM